MDKNSTPQGFDAAKLATVAPVLQGVVDAGDLSGIVTLIWRDGADVQFNAIGKRDIEHDRPMTRDTLFRIASMTKPITSVAALMLMEEGKLKLDDPIHNWLPEFTEMEVMRHPEGELNNTYPLPRPITVEDLMTHRAGLAYGFSSKGPLAKAHEEALGMPLQSNKTPDEWLAALADLPLTYPPGERLHYSHATDVLGFLVARVSGMTFRDFLKQRILNPLGMKDTDFFIPKEKRERGAVVYQQDPTTGALKPVPFQQFDEAPAFNSGGGGLISTADDYLAFARMLLNKGELDGKRYLKKETVELMTSNHLTPEQRGNTFLGMPLWMGQGFGLGVSVIMEPEKHAWMGAGSKGAFGWPGAFGTWWQADPEKNMVMLFLIQNYIALTPDVAAQAVTAAPTRMGARVAAAMFQKTVYGAITE